MQKRTPGATYPQQTRKSPLLPMQSAQTRKSPLLPTPSVPARSQIRKIPIPGPPTCSNSQHHCKQYIPGPYNAINNKQHLQLLPSPHQHTMQGSQRPIIIGTHRHTQGQFLLQVPIYVPILVITLTDQLINLLANQVQLIYLVPHKWNTCTAEG